MRFEYRVVVEVSHVSGKFASRDDIGSLVHECMLDVENAIELDGLGPDGDSEYQIDSCEVDEVAEERKARRPKRKGEPTPNMRALRATADAIVNKAEEDRRGLIASLDPLGRDR